MNSAYMMAQAASFAHPQVDIQKVGESLKDLYHSMRSSVPYLTGGQTAGDALEQEREEFAQRFERYRDATLREKKDYKPEEQIDPVRIIDASKLKGRNG